MSNIPTIKNNDLIKVTYTGQHKTSNKNRSSYGLIKFCSKNVIKVLWIDGNISDELYLEHCSYYFSKPDVIKSWWWAVKSPNQKIIQEIKLKHFIK